MMKRMFTLCFLLVLNSILSKELHVYFNVEVPNNEVEYFEFNIDHSKANFEGKIGFFFCNIYKLGRNDRRQQKYYLYPSNSVLRVEEKRPFRCYTRDNERKLDGKYTIQVVFSNVSDFSDDIKNFKAEFKAVGADKSKSIEISSTILDLKKDRTTSQHTQFTRNNGIIEVETRLGYKMLVEESDNTISLSIRQFGMWQYNIAKVLSKITKSGDKVLHLGGHIGTFDVLFGHLVGDKGKVIVYEPLKRSFDLLTENLRINHADHIVKAVQKGAYSVNLKKEIAFVPDNTGASYIKDKEEDKKFESFEAELVTIDDDSPSEKFDLVMMDIEGCEVHAYNGMRKTLSNYKKPIMLIEWALHLLRNNNDKQKGDFFKFLDELSSDHEFFLTDLFKDIYTKVDKEFLKDHKFGNLDVLIVPKNHALYKEINDDSVILYPSAPYSDFPHSRQSVYHLEVDELTFENCQSGIDKNSELSNKTVICKARTARICKDQSPEYWCLFEPHRYSEKQDL